MGYSKNISYYLAPRYETITPGITIFSIQVDCRQVVARSYFLVPPSARQVYVILEAAITEHMTVEYLDNNLQTLHKTGTTVPGAFTIEVSDFLDGSCYLRLTNGRLLCISIDKWPHLLPPFLRHPPK